jgi:hypothetical protein
MVGEFVYHDFVQFIFRLANKIPQGKQYQPVCTLHSILSSKAGNA